MAEEDRSKFPEPKIVDMTNPANVIAEKIRNLHNQIQYVTKDQEIVGRQIELAGDKIASELENADLVSNINYQGLLDQADAMASLLKEIEDEAKNCAECEHDGPGGYPAHDFLEKVCYLFYKYPNYHRTNTYIRR